MDGPYKDETEIEDLLKFSSLNRLNIKDFFTEGELVAPFTDKIDETWIINVLNVLTNKSTFSMPNNSKCEPFDTSEIPEKLFCRDIPLNNSFSAFDLYYLPEFVSVLFGITNINFQKMIPFIVNFLKKFLLDNFHCFSFYLNACIYLNHIYPITSSSPSYKILLLHIFDIYFSVLPIQESSFFSEELLSFLHTLFYIPISFLEKDLSYILNSFQEHDPDSQIFFIFLKLAPKIAFLNLEIGLESKPFFSCCHLDKLISIFKYFPSQIQDQIYLLFIKLPIDYISDKIYNLESLYSFSPFFLNLILKIYHSFDQIPDSVFSFFLENIKKTTFLEGYHMFIFIAEFLNCYDFDFSKPFDSLSNYFQFSFKILFSDFSKKFVGSIPYALDPLKPFFLHYIQISNSENYSDMIVCNFWNSEKLFSLIESCHSFLKSEIHNFPDKFQIFYSEDNDFLADSEDICNFSFAQKFIHDDLEDDVSLMENTSTNHSKSPDPDHFIKILSLYIDRYPVYATKEPEKAIEQSILMEYEEYYEQTSQIINLEISTTSN